MVVTEEVSIGHYFRYVAHVSGPLHGRRPLLTWHSMKTRAGAFQPKAAKYEQNLGVGGTTARPGKAQTVVAEPTAYRFRELRLLDPATHLKQQDPK